MSEEKKKTGIGHDDDGNIDDKRVAGWILFGLDIVLGVFAVAFKSQEALELIRITIWPWMILMGAGVAEKFKPGSMGK